MSNTPIVLMILDGFGYRIEKDNNAIFLANPENFYKLWETYPHTLLKCSGMEVGLPSGQMGNSEVGHLNIGSGRVVYQEITRISKAIADKSFFCNEELLKAISNVKNNGGNLHLMGLLSDGGVHSHIEHLLALLRLAKAQGLSNVYVHAFLDGRDVAPKSALTYITILEEEFKHLGIGQIATLSGRYYGMDRDNNWERVELSYRAITEGAGEMAPHPYAAINNSYDARVTDEFILPTVIIDEQALPVAKVNDGDSLIFFNFRADRAREITRAFTDDEFSHFSRERISGLSFVCMTQYDINIKAPIAFLPQNLNRTLGEVLADHNLRQLRIAETEKYAHVTFFFNGGVEEPNAGESRILIPSPQVATYNLQPEMSAYEVTAKLKDELAKEKYEVIILNYANADMVGHTGVLEAAVKAVKVVDECLKEIVDIVLAKRGTVLITADHGNCELMVCPISGDPHTAHTLGRVPFILVNDDYIGTSLSEGASLQDIAPTILHLLSIEIPSEMTGKPLLKN